MPPSDEQPAFIEAVQRLPRWMQMALPVPWLGERVHRRAVAMGRLPQQTGYYPSVRRRMERQGYAPPPPGPK